MSSSLDAAPVSTAEMFTTPQHPYLLFFDGECAFCNRWVARVKEADQAHRTRFGTKQGPTFMRVAGQHPELVNVDSVVLVVRRSDGSEKFLVRSPAIRKLIDGLPGYGVFALVLHLVPTPISNLGYAIFSKLRTPLFGKWHECRIPIENDRELFLD